ncbi:MAG TPA: hypothetical protein VF213_12695, partial [Dongiaceae bacterium]
MIDGFPRPLAHGYAGLKEEIAKGDAVAAVWALRDAWGAALRFATCLAIADLLQAGAESEAFARALAVLFKWDGPSPRDWTALLAEISRDDIAPGIARRLPGLGSAGSIAFDLTPRLDRLFAGSSGARDRSWYEEQTAGCIPPLHAFHAMLGPILEGWELREGGPNGTLLTGCGESLSAGAHEHVAIG